MNARLVGDAVGAADLLDGLGQLLGVQPLLLEQVAAKARVVLQAQHQVLHAGELILPVFLDVLRARYCPLQVAPQHLRGTLHHSCNAMTECLRCMRTHVG